MAYSQGKTPDCRQLPTLRFAFWDTHLLPQVLPSAHKGVCERGLRGVAVSLH